VAGNFRPIQRKGIWHELAKQSIFSGSELAFPRTTSIEIHEIARLNQSALNWGMTLFMVIREYLDHERVFKNEMKFQSYVYEKNKQN
jgi:hypothetical protein